MVLHHICAIRYKNFGNAEIEENVYEDTSKNMPAFTEEVNAKLPHSSRGPGRPKILGSGSRGRSCKEYQQLPWLLRNLNKLSSLKYLCSKH